MDLAGAIPPDLIVNQTVLMNGPANRTEPPANVITRRARSGASNGSTPASSANGSTPRADNRLPPTVSSQSRRCSDDSDDSSELLDVHSTLDYIRSELRSAIGDAEDDLGNASEQQNSTNQVGADKRVHFPEDCKLVVNYLEPPNPWLNAPSYTRDDIIMSYKNACQKFGVKPLKQVLEQIQFDQCLHGQRYQRLKLSGETIDSSQVEALEEVFRRIQFVDVDLSGAQLDDACASSLFEIIEFYESACRMSIANVSQSLGMSAWNSLARLIRKSCSLAELDMSGCILPELLTTQLGRALKFGFQLKLNDSLVELYLGMNKLAATDGIYLGNMLKCNRMLRVLDLRGNSLQDEGLFRICEGLKEQRLAIERVAAGESAGPVPAGPADALPARCLPTTVLRRPYLMGAGLESLTLSDNCITHTNMANLSVLLGTTMSLKYLDLSHNPLTNEAVFLIKQGLLTNRTLVRISFRQCKLLNEGAIALAEWLAETRTLQRLDLRQNDIATAGLIALFKALQVNQILQQLLLDEEIKREPGVREYAENQQLFKSEIQLCLDRNRQLALERMRIEQQQRQIEEQEAAAAVAVAATTVAASPETASPEVGPDAAAASRNDSSDPSTELLSFAENVDKHNSYSEEGLGFSTIAHPSFRLGAGRPLKHGPTPAGTVHHPATDVTASAHLSNEPNQSQSSDTNCLPSDDCPIDVVFAECENGETAERQGVCERCKRCDDTICTDCALMEARGSPDGAEELPVLGKSSSNNSGVKNTIVATSSLPVLFDQAVLVKDYLRDSQPSASPAKGASTSYAAGCRGEPPSRLVDSLIDPLLVSRPAAGCRAPFIDDTETAAAPLRRLSDTGVAVSAETTCKSAHLANSSHNRPSQANRLTTTDDLPPADQDLSSSLLIPKSDSLMKLLSASECGFVVDEP